METTHNGYHSEEFRFDRDIAKATQARILSKIFPRKMSYSQAEREAGTDKANIQRAAKGNSLLNAPAFSKILVKAFSLRSTYEIRNHIFNCLHLNNYLEKELGEVYTNKNFQNRSADYALLNTVIDPISKEFYALIFAHKRINGAVIRSLYGDDKAEELISTFSKYNVINYHEKIDVIDFSEEMISSSFKHNKDQLSIIASNINENSLDNGKLIYGHDTPLLSTKNKDKAMLKLHELVQEYNEFIASLESQETSLEERTEMIEYSIIGHHSRTMDFNSSTNTKELQ